MSRGLIHCGDLCVKRIHCDPEEMGRFHSWIASSNASFSDIATPLLHASQAKGPWFFYTVYTTSVRTFRTCKGLFKKICQRHSIGGKKSPFGGRFCPCFEAFHVVQSGYSRRVLKMDVSANLGGPANPVGAFLSRRPCWPLCVFETFSASFERVGTWNDFPLRSFFPWFVGKVADQNFSH